jgi:hypothetical protein
MKNRVTGCPALVFLWMIRYTRRKRFDCMTATYRMPAGEIPDDFLNILRQTFRTGEVSITVKEIPEHPTGTAGSPPDETEYLFSSAANKRELLDAVEAEKRGEFYREITFNEAEALGGRASA